MKYLATLLHDTTLITIYVEGADVIYVFRESCGHLTKKTEHMLESPVPIIARAFELLMLLMEPGSRTTLIHGGPDAIDAFTRASDATTLLMMD